MVLEFYYDMWSPPCQAVYLLLKVTGVPFEPIKVDMGKDDQHKPDFVKKNPFGKIPLIVDDGFVMSESTAIMRYIANKYNIADHWFPRQDAQQAAKNDEFLCWNQFFLFKPLQEIGFEIALTRFDYGEMKKKAADEKLLARTRAEIAKGIDHIDQYFLKDQPFICGSEISAADITGASELFHMTCINEGGMYEYNKTVTAWIERVIDRLGPVFDEIIQLTDMIHKIFNEKTPV